MKCGRLERVDVRKNIVQKDMPKVGLPKNQSISSRVSNQLPNYYA